MTARQLPADYRPGLSGYTVTEAIDGRPGAAAGRVRRLQHFTSKLKDGHVIRECRTVCDDRTASGDRAVTAFEIIRDTFGYLDAELYVFEHIRTAA